MVLQSTSLAWQEAVLEFGLVFKVKMSGDTEIEDLEVSDGASENEYSEHEHEPDVVKEEDDHTDMAEQRFRPGEVDENGKAIAKPKPEPKDPLRPRRKKARRACFACQRAHLTCGRFTFLKYVLLRGSVLIISRG